MDLKINIENLKVAVKGIRAMNQENNITFNMSGYGGIYRKRPEEVYVEVNSCATVACFLGLFPYVKGLRPRDEDFINGEFNYVNYERRVLNSAAARNKGDILDSFNGSLWSFLFSGMWTPYDNTLEGALARAQLVIDGKYPGNNKWKYIDYLEGWHKK